MRRFFPSINSNIYSHVPPSLQPPPTTTAMSDFSVNVLVDAKEEYMKQIVRVLCPPLLNGLLSIYEESAEICANNNENDLVLLTFQELLSQVPKWSQVLVEQEADNIVKESQCDYLEDLLTATFVCHTKILTSVRVTNKNKRINLKIPSVERFVHHVYIEMAREFWKHPYLLKRDDVSKLEYQKRLREVETIIQSCVQNTVRKLLPVKNILKEYLAEDGEEDDDDNATSTTAPTSDDGDEMIGGGGVHVAESTPSKKEGRDALTSETTVASANPPSLTTESTSTKLTKTTAKSDEKKQPAAATECKNTTTATPTDNPDKNVGGIAVGSKEPSVAEQLSNILAKEDAPREKAPEEIKAVKIGNKPSTAKLSGGSSSDTPTTGDVIKEVGSLASTTTDIVVPTTPSNMATPLAEKTTASSKETEEGGGVTNLLDMTTPPNSGGSGLTNLLDTPAIPLSTSSGTKDQMASETSQSNTEISLDSIGQMEEVNVDFGMPSSTPQSRLESSTVTPQNVKTEVLDEFDRIASSSSSTPEQQAAGASSSPKNSASSYSFF